MKKIVLLLCLLLSGLMWVLPMSATTQKKPQFSPAEKKQIEKIIRDYLISHPDVLLEAARALQEKERAVQMQRVKKVIRENTDKLFNSLNSQVMGNPNGNVTIVEFYDHQCGYCRQVAPMINKLIKTDNALRVVLKEYPIFGAESEYAAKAVLAARKQGKYTLLHDELLKARKSFTQDTVLMLARKVGIDTKQLVGDIRDPLISQQLDENIKLADELGLNGTPAFIVASYPPSKDMKYFFVPGMPSETMLKGLIKSARE